MPFCPSCRYEYRPEISTCPDCEVRLVTRLPTEDDTTNTGPAYDWIPIARLTSGQYADMVVEALRSKDIPALVDNHSGHFGATGQMGPSSFRPVVGAFTALMVPRQFAEDARQEAAIILGEEWEGMKLDPRDIE